MSDDNKPVTEKKLKAALEKCATKDDLKNHPTKDDLKEILKNYPTKDDLKNNNNELLEMFTIVMQEFEVRDKNYRVESERHFQILLEEAEERFLKTGHDRIGLCEDGLKAINARLRRVEAVAF